MSYKKREMFLRLSQVPLSMSTKEAEIKKLEKAILF